MILGSPVLPFHPSPLPIVLGTLHRAAIRNLHCSKLSTFTFIGLQTGLGIPFQLYAHFFLKTISNSLDPLCLLLASVEQCLEMGMSLWSDHTC